MGTLMYNLYAQVITWVVSVSGESVPQSYIDEQLADFKKKAASNYPVVENMLFSQAGTYMVTYGDGRLAVSTWTWEGSAFDKIHYSWNYANMNSTGASGDCKVEFIGNRCIITEEKSGAADVISGANIKTIYTLVDAK